MRPSRMDIRGRELGSARRLRREGFLSSPDSRVPFLWLSFSDLALGEGSLDSTASVEDWPVLEGEGEEEDDEDVSVPVGLSVYLPSICWSPHVSFGYFLTGRILGKLTAAEVDFSWLDLPVTLKATPLGAVSLNSRVAALRW